MTTFKNTYEKTSDVLTTGNKKAIFDHLYLNQGEIAETIASFLQRCSNSFVKDIATRYTDASLSGKTITISEKQAWCMTFEALKLVHLFLLEAWIESEK